MTELRECPFCGSEAELTKREHGESSGLYEYKIECRNCTDERHGDDEHARALVFSGDSIKELVEAWNTRFEPTCRFVPMKSGPLYDVYCCSRCGYEYAENRCDPGMKPETLDAKRCPNCGSLIEEVDE